MPLWKWLAVFDNVISEVPFIVLFFFCFYQRTFQWWTRQLFLVFQLMWGELQIPKMFILHSADCTHASNTLEINGSKCKNVYAVQCTCEQQVLLCCLVFASFIQRFIWIQINYVFGFCGRFSMYVLLTYACSSLCAMRQIFPFKYTVREKKHGVSAK